MIIAIYGMTFIMLDDRLWLIVPTVILLFSLLGLYCSLRNVTDEDLVYFGCLYVPMDVYYGVYA